MDVVRHVDYRDVMEHRLPPSTGPQSAVESVSRIGHEAAIALGGEAIRH